MCWDQTEVALVLHPEIRFKLAYLHFQNMESQSGSEDGDSLSEDEARESLDGDRSSHSSSLASDEEEDDSSCDQVHSQH